MIKLSELTTDTNIIYFHRKALKDYEDGEVMTVEDMIEKIKQDPEFYKENINRVGVFLAKEEYIDFYVDDILDVLLDRIEESGDAYEGWADEMKYYLKKDPCIDSVCILFQDASRKCPIYKCGQEIMIDSKLFLPEETNND